MNLSDYSKLERICLAVTAGTVSSEDYEQLGKWLMEMAAEKTSSKKITSKLGFERVGECRQDGILEVLTKLKSGDYEPWDSPLHCFHWLRKVVGQAAIRAAYPTLKSCPKGVILNNTSSFSETMPTAVETLVYGAEYDNPYRGFSKCRCPCNQKRK